MRRVRYFHYPIVDGTRNRVEAGEAGEAYFHGFGLELYEDQDPVTCYSVALLELDDGNVISVFSPDIQFLDKPDETINNKHPMPS